MCVYGRFHCPMSDDVSTAVISDSVSTIGYSRLLLDRSVAQSGTTYVASE